jgi:ZIP family zinc transporter
VVSNETVFVALALTVFAGLSTGIGSAIAYLIRKPKITYLSFSLGFSAGVMIYVSFLELLPNSSEGIGQAAGIGAFFGGVLVTGILDMLIPEETNPHHFAGVTKKTKLSDDNKLMRAGMFTAIAIAVHNFPEGLATFGAALSNVKLGTVIAAAIAIHNIPEGISVSMPIYYATGSRNKAFVYSFLSGIAEPLGAIAGFALLQPFLSEEVLSGMLGFVAGIMVYISVDELLPMAHKYGVNHIVMLGFVFGMLVMALSLLMV